MGPARSLWLSSERDDVASASTIRQINHRHDMHIHTHIHTHLKFHTLVKHKEVKNICLKKLAHILIPTVSLRQRRVWERCVSGASDDECAGIKFVDT